MWCGWTLRWERPRLHHWLTPTIAKECMGKVLGSLLSTSICKVTLPISLTRHISIPFMCLIYNTHIKSILMEVPTIRAHFFSYLPYIDYMTSFLVHWPPPRLIPSWPTITLLVTCGWPCGPKHYHHKAWRLFWRHGPQTKENSPKATPMWRHHLLLCTCSLALMIPIIG